MGSKKAQGKHSRQARLEKLAEQEKNGEVLDYGEEDVTQPVESVAPEATEATDASDATVEATAVMPQAAATAQGGGTENALAGLDVDASGFPLNTETVSDGAFVSSNFMEIPKKRKRRALKIFGITMGVLLLMGIAVYIAGAIVFMSRFLPNTFIGDDNISMMTDEEVEALLNDEISFYKLNVTGNGFTYEIASKDIQMAIDSEAIVKAMHEDLDSWRWPLLIVQSGHDESGRMTFEYDREGCEKALAKKVKKFNKDAKAPVNATITFNDKTGKYVVKPEEEGSQLDTDAMKELVSQAISTLQTKAVVTNDHLKKPTIYSTDEKLIESAKLASGMVSAHVDLILDGRAVATVDGEELSKFVSINDKLDVEFKQSELEEWVRNLTLGFDTIGTERHYTRADGKDIYVRGGVYGWEIDSDATKEAVLEAIKAGKKTEIEIPCIATAYTYAGAGGRDWGNRYIDVDLSEQYVRFYGDDGNIIWESACITGAPDGKKNTWEGVWYVNNKESPSTLIGYTESGEKDYETEVKYWMPFEGNGIGLHDAPWQPDFGGNMYAEGYGSHGCVNLPSSAARELYSIVSIGDVVVVHS